jgi:diacylglycerol kinase family enzyme
MTSPRPRIGVVLNANAGRTRRDPGLADRLRAKLTDDDLLVSTRSPDELSDAAERFRAHGVTLLAVVGGDGSASVTLSTFARVYAPDALPPVALLRGGTMNTVANGCGAPRGNPAALLASLAPRVRSGNGLHTSQRSTIRIGDRFGFLFGTGVVEGFLHAYYANGTPTPLSAAGVLARGVASALVGGPLVRRIASPCRASVDFADGAHWPLQDYLTIAAGTVDQIGLGFRPFLRCDERPESFHLLGIYAPVAALARELPRIRLARPMRPGHALDRVTDRAVIRFEGGVARYMLDGEIFETPGELTLTAGPTITLVR